MGLHRVVVSLAMRISTGALPVSSTMGYKNKNADQRLAILESNARYHRTLRGKYARLRQKSKARKISLEISFDQFSEIISQPCFYCGNDLPEAGYGLDRIDSNGGYSVGNVVPCCSDCNKIKSDVLSFAEMVVAMRAVNALRLK